MHHSRIIGYTRPQTELKAWRASMKSRSMGHGEQWRDTNWAVKQGGGVGGLATLAPPPSPSAAVYVCVGHEDIA